jgi:hypothetical protein
MAEGEWTCYRRNYFQMSLAYTCTDNKTGQEMNSANLPNLSITDPHARPGQPSILISGFAVCVSARIASGERKIELVQHTAKRDKGPQIIPTPRKLTNGGNPHLASSLKIATFERMQFKTATANNGKKRAAQQFYTMTIELYAVSAYDGSFILAGFCESNCLVVRGRSPGHYVEGSRQCISPSIRASTNSYDSYDASPRTPVSSIPSPLMALPFQQTTPLMSESVLPMSGSLLTSGASDVFVLSQHTPSVMDNSFTNYSPEFLTNNMWAGSNLSGNNPGMSYDLGARVPLSPPKSSDLLYNSVMF